MGVFLGRVGLLVDVEYVIYGQLHLGDVVAFGVGVPGQVQLGGQVAEGLKLDAASLVIHWVLVKLHWASNVKIETCIVSDQAVPVHSDGGRLGVEFGHSDVDGLVDIDVWDPEVLGKCGVQHDVVRIHVLPIKPGNILHDLDVLVGPEELEGCLQCYLLLGLGDVHNVAQVEEGIHVQGFILVLC